MRPEIKPMKTAAETALAEAFAAVGSKLPGDRRIAERRAAAFQAFDALGLPHRRVEEWKYTDLRALIREAKPLAAAPDAQAKRRAKGADRKSTRLNSSHPSMSYAVFCWKKKKTRATSDPGTAAVIHPSLRARQPPLG